MYKHPLPKVTEMQSDIYQQRKTLKGYSYRRREEKKGQSKYQQLMFQCFLPCSSCTKNCHSLRKFEWYKALLSNNLIYTRVSPCEIIYTLLSTNKILEVLTSSGKNHFGAYIFITSVIKRSEFFLLTSISSLCLHLLIHVPFICLVCLFFFSPEIKRVI